MPPTLDKFLKRPENITTVSVMPYTFLLSAGDLGKKILHMFEIVCPLRFWYDSRLFCLYGSFENLFSIFQAYLHISTGI